MQNTSLSLVLWAKELEKRMGAITKPELHVCHRTKWAAASNYNGNNSCIHIHAYFIFICVISCFEFEVFIASNVYSPDTNKTQNANFFLLSLGACTPRLPGRNCRCFSWLAFLSHNLIWFGSSSHTSPSLHSIITVP